MRVVHPEPLQRFVELFNEGAFWESHEVLEGPWRRCRSDFYKGLILYASAWVHVQRGNQRGVRAQLLKTIRHLEPFRPSYLGVAVDPILAEATRGRAILAADPPVDRWPDLFPHPRIRLRSELQRGDEPELRDTGPPAQ